MILEKESKPSKLFFPKINEQKLQNLEFMFAFATPEDEDLS